MGYSVNIEANVSVTCWKPFGFYLRIFDCMYQRWILGNALVILHFETAFSAAVFLDLFLKDSIKLVE